MTTKTPEERARDVACSRHPCKQEGMHTTGCNYLTAAILSHGQAEYERGQQVMQEQWRYSVKVQTGIDPAALPITPDNSEKEGGG